MRTRFDIGEIIRCHGGEFLGKHNVVAPVSRAFAHMALCRTSALGGHVEVCPECGDMHIVPTTHYYIIHYLFSVLLKVQGDDGPINKPHHNPLHREFQCQTPNYKKIPLGSVSGRYLLSYLTLKS